MLRLLTILTSMLFAASAPSQQITLPIYTEHFTPYNYVENGIITGINVQLMREICEKAQISCEFTVLPWKRAMRMASQQAPSALISTARTPEREELFKWIGPLSSGKNCVYKLAKRRDIVIADKGDLPKYSLGTANDSAYLGLLASLGFENDKNLFLFPSVYGLVKPFAAKRIDLILGSSTSLHKQLAQGALKVTDVSPVWVLQDAANLANYIALHPATDQALFERLQRSFQTLIDNGRLSEIEAAFVKPTRNARPPGIDQHLWDTCVG